MAASVSRLPLDRAVRYAVSDALASVKSYVYDLEYTHRRSPQELATWHNYLTELRSLHQLLLALPNLETAQWLTDEQVDYAPTFTPFVHGIADARTSIRRVHSWLSSLPQVHALDSASARGKDSVFLEQQYYVHQVERALKQLQALPKPGSDAWHAKYEPVTEPVSSMSSQRHRVPAVA